VAAAPAPSWPEQLQQHAELALGKADYANAERLAMQSWQQGTRQGSLCERNWQVIAQVRQHNQDAAGAQTARQSQKACRQPSP